MSEPKTSVEKVKAALAATTDDYVTLTAAELAELCNVAKSTDALAKHAAQVAKNAPLTMISVHRTAHLKPLLEATGGGG